MRKERYGGGNRNWMWRREGAPGTGSWFWFSDHHPLKERERKKSFTMDKLCKEAKKPDCIIKVLKDIEFFFFVPWTGTG